MRNRRTAATGLIAALGLIITSLVASAPAHAVSHASIVATPHVVVDGQNITVRGNAGGKNAPDLYVAVCEGTPTASNCDQSLTGFGTSTAHILQVSPNQTTGAWGPVSFHLRQTLKTGHTPGGFHCTTTCVIGTTNSADPKDHTYNATTPLTFVAGIVKSTTLPKITGKAKVGKKLKVSTGAWSPVATAYSYKWLRDGKAIKHATKAKYKLVKKDRKHKIRCKVTAKRAGYASGVATSKATARVK